MKNSQRSCCPVACTLDIVGDKWTLLVIRDLFLGRTHFKEFAASPEKIATNILTDRLNKLVDHQLVETYRPKAGPNRDAYRLTKKGKSLESLIKAMAKWGLKHLPGTEAKLQPKTAKL